MTERFVGIDVSKETLDVTVRPEEECWQTKNTEEAFGELITRPEVLEPELIIIEAMRGLERAVVSAMAGPTCGGDQPAKNAGIRQSDGTVG